MTRAAQWLAWTKDAGILLGVVALVPFAIVLVGLPVVLVVRIVVELVTRLIG